MVQGFNNHHATGEPWENFSIMLGRFFPLCNVLYVLVLRELPFIVQVGVAWLNQKYPLRPSDK